MTLRDDLLRKAREQLDRRSEDEIRRVFHMHKATLLDRYLGAHARASSRAL